MIQNFRILVVTSKDLKLLMLSNIFLLSSFYKNKHVRFDVDLVVYFPTYTYVICPDIRKEQCPWLYHLLKR